MSRNNISKEAAKEMFLFRGLPTGEVEGILADPRIYCRSFPGTATVCESESFTPCLGLVISGRVRIERKSEGRVVPMSVMGRGEVFGAATLFGGSDYPTLIKAKGRCTVMFFPQEVVEDIVSYSPRAALNYIAFLSDKVRYLNSRIDFYTAGGAKEKVYGYLVRIARDGIARPGASLSTLAGQLDISRASLYRAIDALICEGAVEKLDGAYRILK